MKIYFKIDNKQRVLPLCDWTIDIIPDIDWIIGELEGNAYNDKGIPQWKYINNQIIQRTLEEIIEDEKEIPVELPTEIEKMQADIDFLSMENEYLEQQNEQFQADIDFCLMMLEEI